MGYSQDDMTSHGFRAAASTLLNESGKFNPDAIERALAHQEADAVRKAYSRGEYWQERVTMAQWWADHLDALRDGARVIPLRQTLDG
jgi:integrase